MENVITDILDNPYRISAVIPTYNRENTIKRCLDSILNQTYPIFEIIVVDDGSTDKTVDIIEKEYAGRVTVFRQKNKGAQAARNAGIRMAKGDYIAFLDSDDEWLPDKLKLQVRELDKNAEAVICGDGYIQTDWAKNIPVIYRKSENIKRQHRTGSRRMFSLNGRSGFVYNALLRESFCLFQGMLTSKESLIKIGLLDENVPSFQEWDTAIRLAKIREFSYIHKPLFVYHLHDGETISKSQKKAIDGLEYICDKYKYEIMNQLGSKALVQRYKELMKMCALYKDSRAFQYFIKYIIGTVNIFIFK